MVELVGLPAGRRAGLKFMFYVYILKSEKTGEFYKGLTDNIDRRLKQHLLRRVSSTRSKLPLELIYVEIVTLEKKPENWRNSLNQVLVAK